MSQEEATRSHPSTSPHHRSPFHLSPSRRRSPFDLPQSQPPSAAFMDSYLPNPTQDRAIHPHNSPMEQESRQETFSNDVASCLPGPVSTAEATPPRSFRFSIRWERIRWRSIWEWWLSIRGLRILHSLAKVPHLFTEAFLPHFALWAHCQ